MTKDVTEGAVAFGVLVRLPRVLSYFGRRFDTGFAPSFSRSAATMKSICDRLGLDAVELEALM